MMRMLKTLCCALFLLAGPLWAANLTDINVNNSAAQATVHLGFADRPVYAYFPLGNPDRLVVDVSQSAAVQGLPLEFNGQNLIARVRTSTPKDSHSVRLVFELTQRAKARAVMQKHGSGYRVVLTLTGSRPAAAAPATTARNPLIDKPVRAAASRSGGGSEKVIVAIDAGHGGQDPGATGPSGLHEKNVTIAIARKLRALLADDPAFKPVMTRDGDYFISVMGRSDVARKQGANLLVSIHADAAPNRSATGASVWVLSNRRANSEMANWLEQHEKQSELLGGAGDLLANSSNDPYLSQAVLDLQFGHSQRVGYDVATRVLRELQRVGKLHKRRPEHASLGVLRSPDIPSLLVETGFISNPSEERLLGSDDYQQKVAVAIYRGLKVYFKAHPLQAAPRQENRPQMQQAKAEAPAAPASSVAASGPVTRHTVTTGETLSGIAERYGVSMSVIRDANRLKNDVVWVGQRLRIPGGSEPVARAQSASSQRAAPVKHKVVPGDTLSAIAAKYGVSMKAIQQANNMKSGTVQLGQTLIIPSA